MAEEATEAVKFSKSKGFGPTIHVLRSGVVALEIGDSLARDMIRGLLPTDLTETDVRGIVPQNSEGLRMKGGWQAIH